MTLLDTGFLLDLMAADEGAARRLAGLLEGYDPVAISAITVMELHHGVPRVGRPDVEMDRIRRALRGVSTYPVTHGIAARAGEIDGELAERGEPIGVPDVLIAATALHHGEPVLTRNVKHFGRVAGVEVQTY